MDNPAQPFFQDGLRFECQGSGKCCTSRGEYGFVYLDGEDAPRLAEHLGLSMVQFLKDHCDHSDGWLHLKHPDKDCHYLEGSRCTVYAARPRQCRTWPFWRENLTDARTWREDVVSQCAGAGKGRLYSRHEILKILATEPEET